MQTAKAGIPKDYVAVASFHINTVLESRGLQHRQTKLKLGPWEFRNKWGRLTAEGSFDSKGRQTGRWTIYDWDTGAMAEIRFLAGKQVGKRSVGKLSSNIFSDLVDRLSHDLTGDVLSRYRKISEFPPTGT